MEFGIGHTHIPASRESAYPGGGELPRKYVHTYDLFVGLTAAAEATSTLRVGSGICLVIERDPITTATEVASIDHLSGGRFEFGVGAGWNREEMVNHGTDPRTRMKPFQERVEAMKAIWTEDEASYHGQFVDFDRIWSWPKPALPEAGFARVVHWIPSANLSVVEAALELWEAAIAQLNGEA